MALGKFCSLESTIHIFALKDSNIFLSLFRDECSGATRQRKIVSLIQNIGEVKTGVQKIKMR